MPASDVPPLVESHAEGVVVRFYRHDMKLLRCDRKDILKKIIEGSRVIGNENLVVRVLKTQVVIVLRRPVEGHGEVRVKRGEFFELLNA